MTSTADPSLTEMDSPLRSDDLWTEPSAERLAHLELVRQQCVAQFSSSPLYQAMADKDPDYWNRFSVGVVHLLPTAD